MQESNIYYGRKFIKYIGHILMRWAISQSFGQFVSAPLLW
jgi:hypothetical protein